MEPSRRPLASATPVRAAIAVALIVEALVAVAAAWYLLVFLFAPGLALAALALLVLAPPVAWTVASGRWGRGVAGSAERMAVAGFALVHVGVALLAAVAAGKAIASLDTLGTPPRDVAWALAALAAAVIVLAMLAAALPLRRRSVALGIVLAMTAVGGVTGAGAGVAAIHADSCASFGFDRERWRTALAASDGVGEESDAERMAAALVRCRTLEGRSRREVADLLGTSPGRARRPIEVEVGWVNDGLGPGDGQRLTVEFDRDGRARGAYLSPE